MKGELYHLQINVSDFNSASSFYKEFFSFLGYQIKAEGKDFLGFGNGTVDFWIVPTEVKHLDKKFHRKATGLNHVAFKVSSRKDVNDFNHNFLKKRNMKTLYETPKLFPEYSERYYAVFFEGPDRLKFEVVSLD